MTLLMAPAARRLHRGCTGAATSLRPGCAPSTGRGIAGEGPTATTRTSSTSRGTAPRSTTSPPSRPPTCSAETPTGAEPARARWAYRHRSAFLPMPGLMAVERGERRQLPVHRCRTHVRAGRRQHRDGAVAPGRRQRQPGRAIRDSRVTASSSPRQDEQEAVPKMLAGIQDGLHLRGSHHPRRGPRRPRPSSAGRTPGSSPAARPLGAPPQPRLTNVGG